MSLEFGNQSKSYQSRSLRAALNTPAAIGYETITVDGTIKSLTPTAGATHAFIKLESSATGIAVRILEFKSTAVTTTVGIGLSNLDTYNITNAQNITGFQVTQAQGGTHKLHVQYYK
jgi:hypothetical protein